MKAVKGEGPRNAGRQAGTQARSKARKREEEQQKKATNQHKTRKRSDENRG